MSTFFESPYIAVRWEADIRAVFIEYKRFAKGEPWRTAMFKAIELATREHGANWIVDMRAQKVFDAADERYLQTDLMPRFINCGIRRVAMVMSEAAVAKMGATRVVKDAESRMKAESTARVEMLYFASVEEARAYVASLSKAA